GTRHSAEVFTSPPAGGGFITLAPDFLGYGESASPSADSIEERFQTYTTALTLLKSIDNLNNALSKCESTFYLNKLEYQNSKFETISNNQNLNAKDVFENLRIGILNLFRISDFGFGVFAATDNTTNNKTPCINNVLADPKKVGIWGHSNGGHIALSILELTGKNYPTVLWAPVSKPFPYSILYYTDEFDDHGKALRKVLANFEKNYDVEKYSPTNYLKWVNAKMQIHQGGNDEEVPQKWSDNLTVELKKLDKEIEYFVYPSQDHNFSNSEAWTKAVLRSIEFYRKNFNF
ncbi:MAG: prolyl oligopeptidase family serine peptidase, partial [bacterium]|nr:prolyl oligopeptidase family serine peptidase [bacterium]